MLDARQKPSRLGSHNRNSREFRDTRGVHPQVEAHLLPGNSVELLYGQKTLPEMFAAIRGAQRYVHLEYDVFEEVQCQGEKFSELLAERCAAGVQIAVIYDAAGSGRGPAAFLETLRRAGVRLLRFCPLAPPRMHGGWPPHRRDHRKMLIVDGRLAIVGGVSLKGPAIVQLQRLFLEHWAEQKGERLPEPQICRTPKRAGQESVGVLGSAPACGRPSYYNALLSALRFARGRVWITAGYFLPTPEQSAALADAAGRRIDVRLMLPSHNDSAAALAMQRFGYTKLLKAGVKIYEREGVILHSKSVIVDESWSAVGSSNFDKRSVRFNDEVDVVVVGAPTASALARLFLLDTQRARVIDAESWRGRPWLQRALELFCKLRET